MAEDYEVKLASDAVARATAVTILVASAMTTTASYTIGVSHFHVLFVKVHCTLDVPPLEDWVSQYDSIWVKDLTSSGLSDSNWFLSMMSVALGPW